MSNAGKVLPVAVLAALVWAVASVAEAQPPIRTAEIHHTRRGLKTSAPDC